MTTDINFNRLMSVVVGSDSALYFKTDKQGNLPDANTGFGRWNAAVRYEPFVLQVWDSWYHVFYVNATNGHLNIQWGQLTNPPQGDGNLTDLEGTLAGAPVAVYYDKKNYGINVYGITTDGSWWQCSRGASEWDWSKLPVDNPSRTPVFQADKIFASSDGNGRIDLVGVTVTNDLYHRYHDPVTNVLSAWTSLGFYGVASRPLCFTMNAGRCDIVVKDARDHKLYHTAVDKGVYLGWELVGDYEVIYEPSGSYYADTPQKRFDIAVTGIDGQILHNFCNISDGNLGTWRGGYEVHSGTATATPLIVTTKGGIGHLFHRGTGNSVHWKKYDGTWSDWKSLGGVTMTRPA